MADKSPRQSMTKKTGKSLKEKRTDKRAKAAGNSGSAIPTEKPSQQKKR